MTGVLLVREPDEGGVTTFFLVLGGGGARLSATAFDSEGEVPGKLASSKVRVYSEGWVTRDESEGSGGLD